jgi:hypothetical protein
MRQIEVFMTKILKSLKEESTQLALLAIAITTLILGLFLFSTIRDENGLKQLNQAQAQEAQK